MGETGFLAAEWLFMMVPALVFVWWGGYDFVATLSLRRPSGAALGGAILVIAGSLPVAWFIGWLQSFVLPMQPEVVEDLERLVTADSGGRLLWLLWLLAVTPALCEELVFRGVLLGSTRGLTPWRMVVINGVVFGAFHLSIESFARFLPAVWLGIVITWTVWRTGSIFTGVVMHVLNNGTIVLLASAPAIAETVTDPEAAPPLWLMPLAVFCLGAGLRVLWRLPAGTRQLIGTDDS